MLPIDGGENGERDFFGISSWMQDATRHRFFATAVVDEYTKLWHVWVTAVCDRETGQEYIADIRLGPNNFRSTAPPGLISLPEIAINVVTRPVSVVVERAKSRGGLVVCGGLNSANEGLRLPTSIVGKYIYGGGKDIRPRTKIPFECSVRRRP